MRADTGLPSAGVIRQIVQHRDAVGAVLPSEVEQELALGRLVRLPIDTAEFARGYGIIRLAPRTLSRAARVFVGLLRTGSN